VDFYCSSGFATVASGASFFFAVYNLNPISCETGSGLVSNLKLKLILFLLLVAEVVGGGVEEGGGTTDITGGGGGGDCCA